LIKKYLATSVTLPVDASIPAELRALAAMYTASMIGVSRLSATLGSELTDWTKRLENRVWAQLQNMFISQSVGTAKDVPLWRRLLLAKTRERAVMQSV